MGAKKAATYPALEPAHDGRRGIKWRQIGGSWRFRRVRIGGAVALVENTAVAGVVKSLARLALRIVNAARLAKRLVHVVVSLKRQLMDDGWWSQDDGRWRGLWVLLGWFGWGHGCLSRSFVFAFALHALEQYCLTSQFLRVIVSVGQNLSRQTGQSLTPFRQSECGGGLQEMGEFLIWFPPLLAAFSGESTRG